MSDYLEDLGRELDRAAARRVAGDRRRLPRFAPALAVASAALVAAVLVARGDAPPSPSERPAAVETPVAASGPLPSPPPELRDVPITVANGTTISGLAANFAAQLEQSGWKVAGFTNAPSSDVLETVVFAANEDEESAAAQALGLPRGTGTYEYPRTLTVVLGEDATGTRAVYDGELDGRRYVLRDTGGLGGPGACLQVVVDGNPQQERCAERPSPERPLGLVGFVPLDEGQRELVYGIVNDQAAEVEIGAGIRVQTFDRPGFAGRYFAGLVDTVDAVPATAYDAEGRQLAAQPPEPSGGEQPYDLKVDFDDPGGAACLELRVPDEPVKTDCGSKPTEREPIGLVQVEVLDDGDWLVYGYTGEQTDEVEISNQLRVPTVPREGVRPFTATIAPQSEVYVTTYDANGKRIAIFGARTPGAPPSINMSDKTFMFNGKEIAPGEARRRGLTCRVSDGPIVPCTDPATEGGR